MQADMREYVLSLLDNYKQTSREIALITYELQHFTGISPEDMIEVMSFAHKMENGILENVPRDVPSISFSYREFASRLNQEAANGIVTHLQELLQERDRLLHYVNLLEPRQRSIIISFYFHAKSWNQISSEQHIAIRTALKIRNIAIHELVRMYTFSGSILNLK